MPKSAKKRRDKAADFSKAKLKLGKGKQLASNAIDTSFKARSIALPSQSIAVEKDDSAPTTRRKLSLDDLLLHIKHHNPGTRKDTIFGFRELLDAHWDLIDSSLPVLINATVRIIGDEDASVRKALLSFYSWFLPRLPKKDLAPHAPLILLYTTSAQTHIFPEIRIDAVRFLNVFLEHIPEMIVSGWDSANSSHGSRVLEGYLGVLSAGTITGDAEGPPTATSTASVMLTPASKLVVLQSLSRFLEVATNSRAQTSSENTWFLSPSFTTAEAYTTFDELLKPPSSTRPRIWFSEMDSETDDFVVGSSLATHVGGDDLQQLGNNMLLCREFCESESSTSSVNSFVMRLATTLHSTLVSVFLDCAPAVFSPSNGPLETEMELVMAITLITRALYGSILQDVIPVQASSMEELKAILGYMSPFFPFQPSGRRDVKVEQIFQDLNLIYCDLASRLVLVSRLESNQAVSRSKKVRQSDHNMLSSKDKLWMQAERVREYVLQILGGAGVSSSQLARPLTAAAYTSLLPTIWSLINYSGRHQDYLETSGDVLRATVEHALRTGSKSVLKKSTFDFVARVVLLETDSHYHGAFRVGRSVQEESALEEWLTHLPQVLWELGSSNPSASESIVLFLLRLLQRQSRLIHDKTLASLRTRLAPYFHITHPTRGAIQGPYAKLPKTASAWPSSLRRRVLDLAIVLCTCRASGSCRALEEAVECSIDGTEEKEYWAQLKMRLQ